MENKICTSTKLPKTGSSKLIYLEIYDIHYLFLRIFTIYVCMGYSFALHINLKENRFCPLKVALFMYLQTQQEPLRTVISTLDEELYPPVQCGTEAHPLFCCCATDRIGCKFLFVCLIGFRMSVQLQLFISFLILSLRTTNAVYLIFLIRSHLIVADTIAHHGLEHFCTK